MSIFSTFRKIFFTIVFLFSLVSFSVYKINVVEKSLYLALDQQAELRLLGETLAQGSDYLTDEIRRYAQFGKQVHYDNFWNEVLVTRSRDKAVERLKELKVLPSELAYIKLAKEYSDNLIKTEEKAMEAVARMDLDESRRLVYGEYYDEQKALIMGNIKKFQDIVNARAQGLAKHFYDEVSFYMMLTNLLLLLSGFLVLFLVYNIGFRRLLNPLKKLTQIMQELVKGNLDIPIQVSGKKDEMFEMGQALQVFKENAIKKTKAELELAIVNKSRNLILDSVGEGIYGLNLEGKVTFLNPMAEKLMGYSLEELQEKPIHFIIHHSKPDQTPYPIDDCPICHAFRDGEACSVTDEVFWRKDNSSIPVEYTSTPIFEGQKLAGAVVVFKDISERKYADEVLRRIVVGTSAATGDEFLKSLVKNLATSLGVKFAYIGEWDKKQSGKVHALAVWAEGKLTENLEYSLEGTPCANVQMGKTCYYPDNIQALFPKDHILTEMGIESYLGVPVFDREKKCAGLLVVMHDRKMPEKLNPEAITQVFANRIEAELERHKAEMKLEKYLANLENLVSKRTADLEKSNQNLSEFAFIASHDLQEPLRKVSMFGDILGELNQDLDERSRDYISRMQNATLRMHDFINDLLIFSKLSTEDHIFNPINLNKILEETLSVMEAEISESGGTIKVGTLPDIDADPVQLHQLFQNLISNALKYRKKDVSPFVNIYSQGNYNGNVTINFEDNGIGFDEKFTDKIFQLFQRLHGKNEYEGTGIGLAICKKIAEHHNGVITVNSTLGVGSNFKVVLPKKQSRINSNEVA